MMANKHTPEPWHINGYAYRRNENTPTGREVYICSKHSIDCAGYLIQAANITIAELKSHRRLYDAEFIVRACNAHNDMLEALEAIIGQALHGDYVPSAYIIDRARAAIAKAKGDHNG